MSDEFPKTVTEFIETFEIDDTILNTIVNVSKSPSSYIKSVYDEFNTEDTEEYVEFKKYEDKYTSLFFNGTYKELIEQNIKDEFKNVDNILILLNTPTIFNDYDYDSDYDLFKYFERVYTLGFHHIIYNMIKHFDNIDEICFYVKDAFQYVPNVLDFILDFESYSDSVDNRTFILSRLCFKELTENFRLKKIEKDHIELQLKYNEIYFSPNPGPGYTEALISFESLKDKDDVKEDVDSLENL